MVLEDIIEAIKVIKKKRKNCYDFITKAGLGFIEAVFDLFSRIWKEERSPSEWEYATLIQIYKGKGLKEMLENNRFIHTKEWMPKLFEYITVSKMKPQILSKISKYQIGGKPRHRPQEHLFAIKSIISLYTMWCIPIFLSLWDIKKFFDKECLRDGMDALAKANVNEKLYRLWFLMNKNVKIRVLTGVGLSEYREVGELIGQGSVGTALVSSLNLDLEVNEYFDNSTDELYYGRVRVQPLLYQDDIIRAATSRDRAQSVNLRIEAIMKSKQLEVHPDKSCFLLLANQNRKNLIVEEIRSNPLTYGNDFEIKNKSQEKYLGDYLDEAGNTASILTTIKQRKGRVIHCIYEIGALLEDIRLHCIGGLRSGLLIFNLAIIPYLLGNADTWTEINQEALDELEKIQTIFLSMLLVVPLSCPRPALAWDTGTLLMENRIAQKKLNLLVHLKTLNDDSLAKEIYNEQLKNNWPGLVNEGKELCDKLFLPDITRDREEEESTKKQKRQWKEKIKESVLKKNERDLKEKIMDLSKLETLKNEEYGEKLYLKEMDMSDARLHFRIRTRTTKCMMNQPSDPGNRAALWLCKGCGNIDSQKHLMFCPIFQELREGKSMESDIDVVNYIKEVLELMDRWGL